MTKQQRIHSSVKKALGYDIDISDEDFLDSWKDRSTQVCKPCWELKYCPYGPFVEQSPLLPPTRQSATAHNEHLKGMLEQFQFDWYAELKSAVVTPILLIRTLSSLQSSGYCDRIKGASPIFPSNPPDNVLSD